MLITSTMRMWWGSTRGSLCDPLFIPTRLGSGQSAEQLAVSWVVLDDDPFGFSVARSSASKKVYRDKGKRLPYGTMRITLRKGSSEWYHKVMALLEILARFTSVEHRLQPDA